MTNETTECRASIFTKEQEEQLGKLKDWKPYAIVWGAINPQNQEFEMHADTTRHKLNSYLRKGWLVATVGFQVGPASLESSPRFKS